MKAIIVERAVHIGLIQGMKVRMSLEFLLPQLVRLKKELERFG